MIQDEKVTLLADGKVFEGFEEITVRAALNEAVRAFTVRCSEIPAPGHESLDDSMFSADWHFPPGTRIQIKANDSLLLDGWVEDYEPEGDKRSHSVSLRGRGLGADFVDCSVTHKTGQLEDKTVEEIAKEFGASVAEVEADLADENGGVIPVFRARKGATIHSEVLRVAAQRKITMKGGADGKVILTRAGKHRHSGGLSQGSAGRVKQLSAKLSSKERFSDVTVVGQSADMFDPAQISPKGTAKDTAVNRYRPKVLVDAAETNATLARQRAEWEVSRATGRSLKASLTVHGYRDDGGTLWEPGWLLFIKAPWLRLEQDMLIESVEFSYSRHAGTEAKLEFVDPRAYGGDGPPASGNDKMWDPA